MGLKRKAYRSHLTQLIKRFLGLPAGLSRGMKHGLLILVHEFFRLGEHGQTIVAVTALLACQGQKELSLKSLLRWKLSIK